MPALIKHVFPMMVLLWTTACKTTGQSGGADVKVVRDVNTSQMDLIKKRIPVYVNAMPFTYKADGCYARGVLMSADLSMWDIPLEVVNQSVPIDGAPLKTSDGITWQYHTAPQYYSGGQPFVIDPAHSPLPLTREEWTLRNNVNGVPNMITISARTAMGDYYYESSTPQFQPHFDLNGSVLGAFDPAILLSATKTLSEYIGKESSTPGDKAIKKRNLSLLVQEILKVLHGKGRLTTNQNIPLDQWIAAVKKETGF